jgi:pSer/pThr/pTyr-binding forkhead associated (FHA) protein
VSDQLLTFLKYIFLALLYLFFLRVLRAVWVELREPKPAAASSLLATADGSAQAADSDSGVRGRDQSRERLVVLEPAGRKDQEYPLASELTVGRADGCGVELPEDTFVSQMHARVFRRDGDFYVEDLGSTNGTYLNKKKVTTAVPLRKGDKLQVGKTVLEVQR